MYCYVFKTDYMICSLRKYKPYQPGKTEYPTTKNFITKSTKKYEPYKPYTYKPYTLSPFTYKTISVEVITRPTTRKPYVTTRTTSKYSRNNSPFGSGPITKLPTDSAELKKIGQYCLKQKGADKNCDKALQMLKTRFKQCDRASKSDRQCHDFKIGFCQAFTKFPCCPDILAGRTCSGRSKRDLSALYL